MTEFITDEDLTTDTSSSTDSQHLYANQEQADAKGVSLTSVEGDSSDEIDPRKLYRDPTLSEIRWYYRRTFAKSLVDKPIEDAFKNGFDFTGSASDEAREIIDEPRYGKKKGGFVEAYQMAQKKARRDGFALLFMTVKDNSPGIHTSPISEDITVDEVEKIQVLTIDDLTNAAESASAEEIEEGTGLERDQYQVRETGLVVNVDPESNNFREPIGYMLDSSPSAKFIHADRVLHYTWNPEVDGDYRDNTRVRRFKNRNDTLGEYEGDSVLIPSYDIMKGISKGNWALAQSVFRNASHMYDVTLPEDADESDFDSTVKETRNINAKSAFVFPHGYEMQQHESGNEFDPAPHFEVLFDQICASHEMTKSVLFGTQSGTVSGSETDIKNYFNKVERFRNRRAETDIIEYVTRVKRMKDSRTSMKYEFDGADIEWGPLFKVDDETRIGMFQTQAQALTTLIGNYVVTPDEAREILTEEWTQIDFDNLTEDQMDILDRLNLAQVGQAQGAERAEAEITGETNPRQGGQQGGRPEGAQQGGEGSGATPTGDEFIDKLAERVADKLQDD